MEYARDEKRSWTYYHCPDCDLVFRDPETYLAHDEEKARYETHNNSIENEGYVRFLSPVVENLIPYLKEGSEGLDYGSGPGPILDILFSRKGFKVSNFDPYFNNDEEVVSRTYDFVTCTEVIEHLYKPYEVLKKMDHCLKEEGYLLLMTDPQPGKDKFLNWGYRMDNTHVCFYSKKTMEWISQNLNYELISSEGKISVFRKNSSTP
ncbi:MAG: class I SAM-dependent methyltransferase [Bdellovibrionales bacterium]|nr:class I SAM-dependent methyltransferase [Bdellovibrionales bacterium]